MAANRWRTRLVGYVLQRSAAGAACGLCREHGTNPDEALLEGLRSDAFQIRLCVLMALVKYAMSHSTVGASVNAHRATALYSEMLAH